MQYVHTRMERAGEGKKRLYMYQSRWQESSCLAVFYLKAVACSREIFEAGGKKLLNFRGKKFSLEARGYAWNFLFLLSILLQRMTFPCSIRLRRGERERWKLKTLWKPYYLLARVIMKLAWNGKRASHQLSQSNSRKPLDGQGSSIRPLYLCFLMLNFG